MSGPSQQLPADDPRVVAFETYKQSPEYTELGRWFPENLPHGVKDGVLWSAFIAGAALIDLENARQGRAA